MANGSAGTVDGQQPPAATAVMFQAYLPESMKNYQYRDKDGLLVKKGGSSAPGSTNKT